VRERQGWEEGTGDWEELEENQKQSEDESRRLNKNNANSATKRYYVNRSGQQSRPGRRGKDTTKIGKIEEEEG